MCFSKRETQLACCKAYMLRIEQQQKKKPTKDEESSEPLSENDIESGSMESESVIK